MITTLTSSETLPQDFSPLLTQVLTVGAAAGLLPADFAASFQGQLWTLLEDLSRQYTSGDSTSLPVSVVEDLVQGIYFTLGAALQARIDTAAAQPEASDPFRDACAALRDTPLPDLWRLGQQELTQQIEKGQQQLAFIKQNPLPVRSIAYDDTVTALEHFFLHYDPKLLSSQIPCMIDYQLALPVRQEREGIQFINDFLQNLRTENHVCSVFSPAGLALLLEGCYGPTYAVTICNFFAPVFANACGLAVLRQDPRQLQVTARDKALLYEVFLARPTEISLIIRQAVVRFSRKLALTDRCTFEYLKACGDELAQRLAANLSPTRLDGIFITF